MYLFAFLSYLKKSSMILQKYWLTFFKIGKEKQIPGKEKQGQGKKSNPWIFSFPILKKSRQKIKTEGRSGKNDKDSCQLLYGTTINNWAKKKKIYNMLGFYSKIFWNIGLSTCATNLWTNFKKNPNICFLVPISQHEKNVGSEKSFLHNFLYNI